MLCNQFDKGILITTAERRKDISVVLIVRLNVRFILEQLNAISIASIPK